MVMRSGSEKIKDVTSELHLNDRRFAALRWTKTSAKIYPKGSVQLTATVNAVNGASRAVTWTSSNPQKVAVAMDW